MNSVGKIVKYFNELQRVYPSPTEIKQKVVMTAGLIQLTQNQLGVGPNGLDPMFYQKN